MNHVVQIVESFSFGTAKSVKQLVKTLCNDYKVTVFYGYRDGSDVEINNLNSKVEWIKLPGKGMFKHIVNMIFILQYAKKNHIYLIHGHSTYGGLYSKLIGLYHKDIRVLYSPRGYSFLREDYPIFLRKIFYIVELLSSKRCTTVACGPAEFNKASSLTKKSVQINNSYNINVDEFEISEYKRDVICVGRLCKQKGFDTFLSIAKSMPEIKFTWVGGILPEAEHVPNVEFYDYLSQDEVFSLIKEHKISFLASRWEGLSRFLLESICLGKPIIVSSILENRDFLDVEDGDSYGKNGVSCVTVEDYITAINYIVNNADVLKNMSNNSLSYALKNFDYNIVEEKWLNLYNKK